MQFNKTWLHKNRQSEYQQSQSEVDDVLFSQPVTPPQTPLSYVMIHSFLWVCSKRVCCPLYQNTHKRRCWQRSSKWSLTLGLWHFQRSKPQHRRYWCNWVFHVLFCCCCCCCSQALFNLVKPVSSLKHTIDFPRTVWQEKDKAQSVLIAWQGCATSPNKKINSRCKSYELYKTYFLQTLIKQLILYFFHCFHLFEINWSALPTARQKEENLWCF